MSAARPLSAAYWEALRRLAEPLELMKFTLIYDNDLPAGDSSRCVYASKIRNTFHDQLVDLWDSHVIFRTLRHTARTPICSEAIETDILIPFSGWPEFRGDPPPLQPGQTDLCAPIAVSGLGEFVPLIRNSLCLGCSVDILFLRHEEPLKLLKAGGDLDNRIKTLFDGLRMPNKGEGHGETPTADPLYVVMEDDALITDISVRSGRLLGNRTKKPHAVRLTIDITVKVLRVFSQNQSLIGG